MRTRQFSNRELARILREMAALYEMDGVAFKPRAYEGAALALEAYKDDAQDLFAEGGEKALDAIQGIGKGIAAHLRDLFTTGHFREYERLRKKTPVNILELMAVEGIGPKTVRTLWRRLKIKNLDDLERALRAQTLRSIPGFGGRSEEKLLKAVGFVRESGTRRALSFALPEAEKLCAAVERLPETEKVVVAGSVRRWKETVGDLDLLAVSQNPEALLRKFVRLPAVGHVYGQGPAKANVRLRSGIDADLRVVPAASWGAALNYFTGSKAHNIALRKRALARGFKLSEYGLFKGRKQIAGETEEGLYAALGLPYIEPELREMQGEFDAAQAGKLPTLVGYGDLRGDLQVQTEWTDGAASIEEMADAAEEAGLEYIAVTDHTRSLAMARGLDEKRLAEQGREIDRLNERRRAAGKKLVILKGAEVNIGKDGTLDLSGDALVALDVVGAAVHSHFGLPQKAQTKRLIAAMEHPHVDLIFHPTGRLINAREPIALDMDAVIAAAKRTGTILEIDAYPDRLDLKDEHIRRCVAAGVPMSIDSDAHAPEHFRMLQFGIAQARRGWARRRDIVNTLALPEFRKLLG